MFETTTTSACNKSSEEIKPLQATVIIPIASEIGTHAAWLCLECGLIAEDSGGPLYECDECGERFNEDTSQDGFSNLCPDCGAGAEQVADDSCIECCQFEAERVLVAECPNCYELVDTEFWLEHWYDYHTESEN